MHAEEPASDPAERERLADLVARCVLAYEQDGDAAVERVLAEEPTAAASARVQLDELRKAGLLIEPARDPERIGPYRILQRLGVGGMGTVWLAEQKEPVARRVALKVIRPGMDSREVLARFAVERQTLALLDHPHVARIHDAGTTAEGRPFLVMEYVPGIPLTRYCDERQLGTAERLRLFGQVCDAVQHAHQKGVIHRDLKPSNVLVTDRDAMPWPVVIDFGVAKSVSGRLLGGTLLTMQGRMLGTPEYMSPEQALNELDIDTRTDVYSLGVMLFELLTGTLPIDAARLRKIGSGELSRVLRETEPPTPSARVTELGERAAAVAERRRTDGPALKRRLRGDLDWIALKALARDRNRRYGMPAELAQDIRRHLADEPVMAGPPGARYRLAKFLARNRLQVGSAAVVLLALVGGLVASLVFYGEAEASGRLATANAQRAQLNLERALAAANRLMVFGDDPLLDLPHMDPVRRHVMESALELYREFESLDTGDDARARWYVADAQRRVGAMQVRLGSYAEGLANLQAARTRLLDLAPSVAGSDHEMALAAAEHALASALRKVDRRAEAGPMLAAALERLRALWRAGAPTDALRGQLAATLHSAAKEAREQDLAAGRACYEEAVAVVEPWLREPRSAPPDELPAALQTAADLAFLLLDVGEIEAARELAGVVRRAFDAAVPADAPQAVQRRFLDPLLLLGRICFRLEIRGAARELEARAVALCETLVREHPEVVVYRSQLVGAGNDLATSLSRLGRHGEAVAAHAACIAAAEQLLALDPSPRHRLQFAYALVHSGYVQQHHHAMGGEADLPAARAALDRGLAMLDELPAELQSTRDAQRVQAMGLRCRGMDRADRGDTDGALQDLQRAGELIRAAARDGNDAAAELQAFEIDLRRAELMLAQDRAAAALPVLDAAHAALGGLERRHSMRGDWAVKDREVRNLLARARGRCGDVDGAVALFATLGVEDIDWVGRDLAARGLLELHGHLPADDPRRPAVLARARTVLHASLGNDRAQDRGDAMVMVMRSGTSRILADVERAAGDLRACADAWAGVVEGYELAWRGRQSDRNRTRLAAAFAGQADALLAAGEAGAARAVAERWGGALAPKPEDLVGAARIAARCAAAAPADGTAHREAGVSWLLAAFAAGYRDSKRLRDAPELAALLVDPRVAAELSRLGL